MYELQSPNYETHQICPKLATYRITQQNIGSQSICRAPIPKFGLLSDA